MSQQSIIPAGATEHQATVVRALSRICAVFVTFQGRPPYPSLLCSHNPSAVAGGERLLEWSVHIGSKKWPEMTTCKSTAATMSLLKQALGTYDQAVACSCARELPRESLCHRGAYEYYSGPILRRDVEPIRRSFERFD